MNKAAILAVLFAIGFYLIGNYVCNYEVVGFDIPFIGHVGYKPFAGYSMYVLPVAGLGAIFVYFLARERKEREGA